MKVKKVLELIDVIASKNYSDFDKVKKVLELIDKIDVIKNVPCDMWDVIHPEDTDMQLDGAYYSSAQNSYLPVGDMDIVHLIRAFKKLNRQEKDTRDMYISMGHIRKEEL